MSREKVKDYILTLNSKNSDDQEINVQEPN